MKRALTLPLEGVLLILLFRFSIWMEYPLRAPERNSWGKVLVAFLGVVLIHCVMLWVARWGTDAAKPLGRALPLVCLGLVIVARAIATLSGVAIPATVGDVVGCVISLLPMIVLVHGGLHLLFVLATRRQRGGPSGSYPSA